MRMIQAILFFLASGLSAASASTEETCSTRYWTLEGNMTHDVLAYDAFLKSLMTEKDPLAKLNDYIRKHGLLIQLNSQSGTVRGYENYLQGEGSNGLNVGLFLKYMRVMAESNVTFDSVYEVETADSKQAIRKWNVPYGASAPLAVRAFDVIYRETLTGICSEIDRKVTLKVSTEGIYKAIDHGDFAMPTLIPEGKCNAQRAFFHQSKTAACAEYKDLGSGKRRILVWDTRIK